MRNSLIITAAGHSETGKRENNEDYFLIQQEENRVFAAVADGLGGHSYGEVASRTACMTAIEALKETSSFRLVHQKVQEALYRKQQELHEPSGVRTTLNLVFADNTGIRLSHIGDTRTYVFRNRRLLYHTRDHSVLQMRIEMGEMKEEEIRFHKDRSRILRVMGTAHKPAYEEEEPLQIDGETQILICTDGFWEMINERQMLWCLEGAEDAQGWLDDMFTLAGRNSSGKDSDNATAVCLWIKGVEYE